MGRFARARQKRNLHAVDAQRNAAACGHFARVAEEAEASDVSDGVNRRLLSCGVCEFVKGFRSVTIEARHGSDGCFDGACGGFTRFEGRGNDACPNRFREDQSVARACADIAPDTFGVDDTGDGVAEFQIVVANGMAADDRATGLVHFRQAAAEDLFENNGIATIGESDNREGGNGTAAHGVNVTEGVGGGDLAEGERIVGDGREEIDGLHEREIVRESIHPCVVAGIKTNEQIGIIRPRQTAKHGVQKTWTSLAAQPAALAADVRRTGSAKALLSSLFGSI